MPLPVATNASATIWTCGTHLVRQTVKQVCLRLTKSASFISCFMPFSANNMAGCNVQESEKHYQNTVNYCYFDVLLTR